MTTIPLRIRHDNAGIMGADIEFWTRNIQRMTIMGTNVLASNDGFVGIGITNPQLNLEVLNNIGLIPQSLQEGYYINRSPVLRVWPLGVVNNIFVGTDAGNNPFNTGTNLSFVGTTSGMANTSGTDNTFMGFRSGRNNTAGSANVFLGSSTGISNTIGTHNVFVGMLAGQFNNTGSNNVAVGDRALSSAQNRINNVAIGFDSGINFTTGDDNFFGGANSAFSLTGGRFNVFLGSNSGNGLLLNTANNLTLIGANTLANNNITNASAIGAGSIVNNSNNLILGDNNVNVGIGFSNSPVGNGPAVKLEINTDPANFVYSGLNQSGLRFTQLINTSPASPGITRFLTVNNTGDVILGDIPGGGGSVNACPPGGLTNLNYITKITALNEICKTEGIYESASAPYTVGIGIGASPNAGPYNNFKLDIQNDLYLRHKYNNNLGGDIGGDIWMQSHTGQPKRVFSMYGYFGQSAIAIGPNTGSASQFADLNTNNCIYIGMNTGPLSFDDNNNTFVGGGAGQFWDGTISNGFNTLIGAGIGGVSFLSGDFNSIFGDKAAFGFIGGTDNTMVGQSAMQGFQRGDDNAALGGATLTVRNASRLVLLGASAQAIPNIIGSPIDNAVSIGFQNSVQCSNCVTLAAQPYLPNQQQVGMGYASPTTTPSVLTGTVIPSKLYVNVLPGFVTAAVMNGDVYASATFVPSDSSLKDNIVPFTDGLALIDQIEAKSYTFDQAGNPSLTLPTGNQVGFMANDIEIIAPQLVKCISTPADYDSLGNVISPQVDFKSVNYTGLIPILFTAIKQQQAQIDSLAQAVSLCCAQPIAPGSGNRSSINLSNHASIILNQNVPNPFKDKTDITFEIPADVNKAAILFYDASGKILYTFEITGSGSGALTVYGDDLSSGIYTYTLMVDGKPIQTKKMVKE